MPEIFNRESTFLSTVDPGLKIAGVTNKKEVYKGEFFPPYTEEDAFSSLVAFHSHIF